MSLKIGDEVICVNSVSFVDGTYHRQGDRFKVDKESLEYFQFNIPYDYVKVDDFVESDIQCN